jgi:hypothetical protein
MVATILLLRSRLPGIYGDWMNHAGGDHGAAVPGRVAHFFDIVANELVGGLGMSGNDSAMAVDPVSF